jgi:hypothetical protein
LAAAAIGSLFYQHACLGRTLGCPQRASASSATNGQKRHNGLQQLVYKYCFPFPDSTPTFFPTLGTANNDPLSFGKSTSKQLYNGLIYDAINDS